MNIGFRKNDDGMSVATGLRKETIHIRGTNGSSNALFAAWLSEEFGYDAATSLGISRTLGVYSQVPQNVVALPLLAGVPTTNLVATGAALTLTFPSTHPKMFFSMTAQVFDASVYVYDSAANLIKTWQVSDQSDGVDFTMEPGLSMTVQQAVGGTVTFTGMGFSGLLEDEDDEFSTARQLVREKRANMQTSQENVSRLLQGTGSVSSVISGGRKLRKLR